MGKLDNRKLMRKAKEQMNFHKTMLHILQTVVSCDAG